MVRVKVDYKKCNGDEIRVSVARAFQLKHHLVMVG